MTLKIGWWLTAALLLGLSYPGSPWYRFWLIELAGAFYLWFGGLTLGVWLGVGWVQSPRLKTSLRLILAIALAMHTSTLLPWYIPPFHAATAQGQQLTVMTYNVNHQQWNLAQVAATVRSHPVDLFGLVEPKKEQASELRETLQDLYPYYYRATGGGTSLFSRYPLQSPRTENFGAQDHSLVAELEIAQTSLQVIVTHPLVPRSRLFFRRRNELIAAIARYAKQNAQQNPNQPLIIMGDFNATPWSAYVREFVRVSGLRDATLGYGLTPTWFYWGASQSFSLESCIKQLFKIPIDYIFVSPELRVKAVMTLPSGASDHRPLLARVEF
ncbi:MAG: endonuclease/exonuclease/phosphatase family protein [Cyanobacteria bacterium P01_G01_bin.54]